MIDTKDKEIERLKDDNKYLNKVNIELSIEKNILKSIIKEVREYIDEHIKYECDYSFNCMQLYSYHLYDFNIKELLKNNR